MFNNTTPEDDRETETPAKTENGNPAKETQPFAPELLKLLNFMDDSITVDPNSRGFTPMQTNIFNMIKSKGTSEAGVARDIILASFPEHQHKEVNNALEFLINEGDAYSTFDNDHFKITVDN